MSVGEHNLDEPGLECIKCGCRHFYVIRTVQRPRQILRRRECRNCGWRVSTVERIRSSRRGAERE